MPYDVDEDDDNENNDDNDDEDDYSSNSVNDNDFYCWLLISSSCNSTHIAQIIAQ